MLVTALGTITKIRKLSRITKWRGRLNAGDAGFNTGFPVGLLSGAARDGTDGTDGTDGGATLASCCARAAACACCCAVIAIALSSCDKTAPCYDICLKLLYRLWSFDTRRLIYRGHDRSVFPSQRHCAAPAPLCNIAQHHRADAARDGNNIWPLSGGVYLGHT